MTRESCLAPLELTPSLDSLIPSLALFAGTPRATPPPTSSRQRTHSPAKCSWQHARAQNPRERSCRPTHHSPPPPSASASPPRRRRAATRRARRSSRCSGSTWRAHFCRRHRSPRCNHCAIATHMAGMYACGPLATPIPAHPEPALLPGLVETCDSEITICCCSCWRRGCTHRADSPPVRKPPTCPGRVIFLKRVRGDGVRDPPCIHRVYRFVDTGIRVGNPSGC